jgi:hypothetical protein
MGDQEPTPSELAEPGAEPAPADLSEPGLDTSPGARYAGTGGRLPDHARGGATLCAPA